MKEFGKTILLLVVHWLSSFSCGFFIGFILGRLFGPSALDAGIGLSCISFIPAYFITWVVAEKIHAEKQVVIIGWIIASFSLLLLLGTAQEQNIMVILYDVSYLIAGFTFVFLHGWPIKKRCITGEDTEDPEPVQLTFDDYKPQNEEPSVQECIKTPEPETKKRAVKWKPLVIAVSLLAVGAIGSYAAYTYGSNKGWHDGYDFGYQSGYNQGDIDGFAAGWNDGYDEIADEYEYYWSNAVIVNHSGEEYHHYGCSQINWNQCNIFDKDFAEWMGYVPCEECATGSILKPRVHYDLAMNDARFKHEKDEK